MSHVASCVEGLAKTLISNDGGAGDAIFNSPTVGIAIKHLVKAVLGRPQQYPLPDEDDGDEATVALLPEIDTNILSADQISQLFTKGVVEELQDPLWARRGSVPDPTMMVRGMRKDVGSSEAHGGRRVSTIMLTLLDGSGLLISSCYRGALMNLQLNLITIIIAESAFYVYIHCTCTFTKLISDNSTSLSVTPPVSYDVPCEHGCRAP
jgi:hypothetical protein